MPETDQNPSVAEASAAHADDLLAGVRVAQNPLGIEVAADTWLRQDDSGRALMVVLSGFMAILFGLPALGFLLLAPHLPAGNLLVVLGFGSISALFGWVAVRRARAGVRVSADGVCLRGLVNTHRLSLHEVERFEPGVFRSLPGHREIGVQIVCRGGRRLDIWAMGSGAVVTTAGEEEGKAALQPLCEALDRLLGDMERGMN